MSLKDYEIISKLGAGSFGVVHKAVNKKTGDKCVIKEMNISKIDARLKKWAMNEAKLMSEINSPYIVRYFDSFIDKGKIYIVMQHCVNGDLAKYIKSQMGKPIKQETIWKFVIQIMIGLRDLHLKKILHRDIKTLNIFLDENSNIRIGDLGVAKTLTEKDFTNTIVGTPYYLSPQMCEEKPYNQKTDVWAMGCLVYELCTGKHPFQAQNQAALALKIVMGRYQEISSLYSKELKLLLKNCLSVDYKRRPTVQYLLQTPSNSIFMSLEVVQQAKKLKIDIKYKKSEDIDTVIISKNQEAKKIEDKKQALKVISQKPINQTSKKKLVQNKSQSKINSYSKQAQKVVKPQTGRVQEQKKPTQKSRQKKEVKNEPLPLSKPFHQPLSKEARKMKIDNLPPAMIKPNSNKKDIKPSPGQIKSNLAPNQKSRKSPKFQNAQKRTLPQTSSPKVENKNQQQKLTTKKDDTAQPKKDFIPSSNYMVQKAKNELINQQDKGKVQEDQIQVIKDIGLLDIQSQDKEAAQLQNDPINSYKKTAFVGSVIQKQVDDDLLLEEFGITTQKSNHHNNSSLATPPSLFTNVSSAQSESLLLTKTTNNNQSKINRSKQLHELPTVRTTSHTQNVTVLQGEQDNNNKDDVAVEEIDDNQPYISDEDENQSANNINDANASDPMTGEQDDDQQWQSDKEKKESEYLIENIEAEIMAEEIQSIEKSIQVYSKKLLQNQKRMLELINMKNHTEKEYFLNKMSKEKYLELKEKINSNDDKQMNQLMKEITGGKQQMVMKFLKIVAFQMEMEICEKNINDCKDRISELKLKQSKIK